MNDSNALILTLEKALTVIEAMSRVEEIGISELNRELGLGKATIYRILNTLRVHGYVEQTVSEKYKLNFKLFELGNRIVNQIGIRKSARPFLEKLAVVSKETVNLAVLDNCSVIYIDRIESREPLRMGLDVGARFPAFCTALGLAILAHLNSFERDNLLAQMQQEGLIIKHTSNTIVDINHIKNQLQTIREQGYSSDNEYCLQGIRGIAAPIFNHAGRIRASISVAGPIIRMTDKVVSELIPEVKETARSISAQLGYNPLRTSN